MHHAGIIHRDIKPYNLLVTDHDTIKICDFGFSKVRGENFSGPPTLKFGSAWYAPPEQEDNPDSVDFSADLYAVGITLYRMLTGFYRILSCARHTAYLVDCLQVSLRYSGKCLTSRAFKYEIASKGILPYRGLGSGIKRALDAWPEIDFIDDRDGCLFTAIVHRKAVKRSEIVSVKADGSPKSSEKSSERILH